MLPWYRTVGVSVGLEQRQSPPAARDLKGKRRRVSRYNALVITRRPGSEASRDLRQTVHRCCADGRPAQKQGTSLDWMSFTAKFGQGKEMVDEKAGRRKRRPSRPGRPRWIEIRKHVLCPNEANAIRLLCARHIGRTRPFPDVIMFSRPRWGDIKAEALRAVQLKKGVLCFFSALPCTSAELTTAREV
jgi:hypothetical protein